MVFEGILQHLVLENKKSSTRPPFQEAEKGDLPAPLRGRDCHVRREGRPHGEVVAAEGKQMFNHSGISYPGLTPSLSRPLGNLGHRLLDATKS